LAGEVLVMKNRGSKTEYQPVLLHPVEKRFVEYLRRLRYANLEVKVQDGLPVMAEKVTEKVKFTEE
jgi:hypothetical protein